MNRGDIHTLRSAKVPKLVVVVSRDSINDSSTTVLVVPCVEFRKSVYPSQVPIEAAEGGPPEKSLALAELVQPIDKTQLGDVVGKLPRDDMNRLEQGLLTALSLPGGSRVPSQ